ncbi:MAG: GYF domain-containing protein [Polyangiales bacterium]
MDFQCDRCGQKYHVADEKLQGRAASRFKCKKCENVVLLTGPGAATPSVFPPSSSPSGSPLRAPTATGPVRMISATPAPSTSAAPAPRPSVLPGAAAPAKPRPATTTGPAYSQSPRPSVAPAAAARLSHVPAAPDPDEMGWFAGIRDIPVGPVTRAEMVKYIEAGEATSETLVWRDGFADWRPLRLVPAFKDLALAQAQRPSTPSFHENEGDATTVTSGPALMAAFAAQAPAEPPTEAPTRRLSALTDEAALRAIRVPPATGEKPAARFSAPAPAPRPSTATPMPAPAPTPAPAARTGAPIGTPLGAPKPAPSPLAKPLGAPMRTPTIATPSVGARPAPTGPALGPAPRTSAPPAPPPAARKLEPLGPRPADPAAAPTPPRATPAAHGPSPLAKPLGPGLAPRTGGVGPSPLAKPLAPLAKPAPPPEPTPAPELTPPPAPAPAPPTGLDALDALDALAEAPAEHAPVLAPVLEPPTVVTAPTVVEPPTEILASAEAPTLTAPALEAPTPEALPEPPAGVKVGGAQWDDPLFHVSAPPPAATSSPAPAARSSDPAKQAWNDPVFNSLPPAAAAVAVPSLAPAAQVPSSPPHGVTTAQIPVTVDVDRAKPKGFPKGVLVLAAGLAVVGIAGGIALSRPKPSPPEARPAAHAPIALPTPATQPAPAEPAPTEPAAQPAPTEPAAQPTENPASPDMAFAGPGSDNARSSHGGGRRTPRPQATPESQAATQAALERALGIHGGAAPPPSTQIATPPMRNTAAAPNAPSAPQANAPVSAARSLDREQRAQSAIERSGVIRRCWEQFKLRNPAATRRSLTINFAVSAAGAVTLRVPNTSEPTLSNCIERGSRDVRSLGDGSPSSGSTRADLD